MCGICGETLFTGQEASAKTVRRMRDALRHRGPDDDGLLADGRVALGHRRLSIIDLSPLGRQPMKSADGRYAIVFNGEIYNYQDIRPDLEARGVAFKGNSDTETAVNAVAVYGVEEAISRFLGMFAMALWDFREKTLHLCRDRVGVKPLYYSLDDKRCIFGSEMRALAAHPEFSRQLNRKALYRFFRTGYFEGPDTVFARARKVPPGTILSVGPNGGMRQKRYFDINAVARGSFKGSFEEAQEELSGLCRDAFRLRLVSDAPVGVFLSGGVDSSLVSAVLAKDLGANLAHFTIGFAERSHDESGKARLLSQSLGLDLEVLELGQGEAARILEDFCEIYDEPFGDPSGIPTYVLSQFARRRVKVALSADGGDEQFCGYTGYTQYPKYYGYFNRLPGRLGRTLARTLRAMPYERIMDARLLGARRDALAPDRAAKFERLLSILEIRDPRELAEVYAARGFSAPEARRLLGLGPEARAWTECPEGPDGDPWDASLPAPRNADELADLLMRRDYAYWLPEDILFKVDRASMASSLECRDPLLDHRIGELAFSLPMRYLTGGGEQKRILRALLRRSVGGELADQAKRGFSIPLAVWLKGAFSKLAKTRLSPERVRAAGVLDPAMVSLRLQRFLAGEGVGADRVWLMLNFQMWAERWL